MSVEIPKKLVEIYTYNASTKRCLSCTPFDKISKSGDGGDGEVCFSYVRRRYLISMS